jgi:hypothetical protein
LQFATNIFIAFASDELGSDLSLTPGNTLNFMAVAVSPTAPASYSGWQQFRDSVASANVRGEELEKQGCIFLLAHLPIGDIDLFLNGQRLTRGIDYFLNGREITMAKMPFDTDILRAGYNY